MHTNQTTRGDPSAGAPVVRPLSASAGRLLRSAWAMEQGGCHADEGSAE